MRVLIDLRRGSTFAVVTFGLAFRYTCLLRLAAGRTNDVCVEKVAQAGMHMLEQCWNIVESAFALGTCSTVLIWCLMDTKLRAKEAHRNPDSTVHQRLVQEGAVPSYFAHFEQAQIGDEHTVCAKLASVASQDRSCSTTLVDARHSQVCVAATQQCCASPAP